MRILVVGASGMLGHRAIGVLSEAYEVWGACRRPQELPELGVPADRLLRMEVTWPAAELIEKVQPDVVVNAVGIVKQRSEAKSAIPSIVTNSLWPHVLAKACEEHGARLVHVSTDCVFSGTMGKYDEGDLPDATDLYGRSKLLGEVVDRANAVTLRTSIIGWQLGEPTGLVEWFAAHRSEPLLGYRRAVFSGLTTAALAEVIRDVVIPRPELAGLWHVSAEPIDKDTLLRKLARLMGWDVEMRQVLSPVIDRSLDSTRFQQETGWRPPSWDRMLEGLAEERA